MGKAGKEARKGEVKRPRHDGTGGSAINTDAKFDKHALMQKLKTRQ